MLNIPKNYIIEKIKEKSGMSNDEINAKIAEKLNQLQGLISEEGAAHIIANEMGIKLMDASEKLQIKNVFSGMRNVEIVGKVTRIFEVRHFQTGQRQGKVGNFMIADETGSMRVVCWGDKADILETLKEDNIVKIKSAYSRDNQGRIELHLNDNSNIIINPEGESIGDVKTRTQANRKKINELSNDDQNTEIFGTIVSLFDPRFFEVCSACGKRAKQMDGAFTCAEHGSVDTPDYSYVINAIVDDGSGNIRTIFFKNQMQHLLNMTHDEIISNMGGSFENLKNDQLGRIIKVIGRVVTNDMFSRQEFIAQIVERDPNPEAEINRLDEVAKVASKINDVSEQKPIIKEHKAPVDIEIKSAPVQMQTSYDIDADNNDDDGDSLKDEAISIDDIEDMNDDDIYE